MGQTETISDLVVLGRTGPETLSGGDRTTVCLGGYSEEYGYVRLFPTRMEMDTLQRWNVVEVPVEKPENDTREESWKIEGSRSEWDQLPEKVEKVGELDKGERIDLVNRLSNDCTDELNERKVSVGLAKVEELHDLYFTDEDRVPPQQTLDGRKRLTKNSYPKLYVKYTCGDCKLKTHHEQHLIQWGMYRLYEKYDDEEVAKEKVKEGSKLNDDAYQNYLLLGNQLHQRTAFIIGSVLSFKKSDLTDHGVRPDEQAGLTDF